MLKTAQTYSEGVLFFEIKRYNDIIKTKQEPKGKRNSSADPEKK
ncbi:MAG: hypothetical protein ACLU5B_05690 [Mediterraneibacter faecis]